MTVEVYTFAQKWPLCSCICDTARFSPYLGTHLSVIFARSSLIHFDSCNWSAVSGLVDILELKDRIVLLYSRAQLDGENSELDALKRLASSHSSSPALPLSTQLSTGTLSMENSRAETSRQTVAITTPTEFRVKVECQTPSERPGGLGKRAKLLLIPETLSSSLTKPHSVAGNNRSVVTQQQGVHGGWKSDQPGSLGLTKRRNVSQGGQKSVPLGDVMNVQLPGARVSSPRGAVNAKLPSVSPQGAVNAKLPSVSPQGAVNVKLPSVSPQGAVNVKLSGANVSPRVGVSLIPLASVASSAAIAHPPPVTLDWNRGVMIKVEPGLSCQRAGKRKLSVEHGMFCMLECLVLIR